MHVVSIRAKFRFVVSAAVVSLLSLTMSCGGGSTTTSTTTSGGGSPATNPYALAYMAITNWGAGVTVAFPANCSMTVSATGAPPSHNAYYLAPAGTGQTVAATTPSGIQLAVIPYTGGISTVNKISATFNICPTKATSSTPSSMGAIGLISSGEVLFNAYEATKTVALADNASYTFSSGGTSYTASFIDQCNSHPTGGMGGGGSTWHYHGVPTCWTSTVDGAAGPSHIIGIALDGYPIYGGRDLNGNAVAVSSLDACNGITSATPEFPNGAYHYVLPLNTTTAQSSIGCYSGTVGTTITAWAQQLKCTMLMAMLTTTGGDSHWVPALPKLPMSVAAKNLAAKQLATQEFHPMLKTSPHPPAI
jgi:YHYH protein